MAKKKKNSLNNAGNQANDSVDASAKLSPAEDMQELDQSVVELAFTSVDDDLDVVEFNFPPSAMSESLEEPVDYSGVLSPEDLEGGSESLGSELTVESIAADSSSSAGKSDRDSAGSGSNRGSGSEPLENVQELSDWRRDRDVSQKLDAELPPSYGADRQPLRRPVFIPPIERNLKDRCDLPHVPAPQPQQDYHITGFLGQGGYGIVYEAEQLSLNRSVALKVFKDESLLLPPIAADSGAKKPAAEVARQKARAMRQKADFLAEAHLTAKLAHPNIIRVHEVGMTPEDTSGVTSGGGHVFYSMEIMSQKSWNKLIRGKRKRNTVNLEQDIERFLQLAAAIAYAHARKVIHRDLKPANVMLGDFNQLTVVDWGLAVDLEKMQPAEIAAGGTARYMAPEMVRHFKAARRRGEISYIADLTIRDPQAWNTDQFGQFEKYFANRLKRLHLADKFGSAEPVDKVKMVYQVLADYFGFSLLEVKADERHASFRNRLTNELQRQRAIVADCAKQLSYASDIYLLGGILWEIVYGNAPHEVRVKKASDANSPTPGSPQTDKKVEAQSFRLSEKNLFQRFKVIKSPLRITLAEIAEKALALKPEDRFASVTALMDELKRFQSQLASRKLTDQAKTDFNASITGADYGQLLGAAEKCVEALRLWPENDEALELKDQVAELYGYRAWKKSDYDSGLNFLETYHLGRDDRARTAAVDLRNRLLRGRKIRNITRTAAVVGWVSIFGLLLPAIYVASKEALSARAEAANEKAEAAAQTEIAKKAKTDAKKAETDAKKATEDANSAEVRAKEAARIAEERTRLAVAQTDSATKQIANASLQLEDANRKRVDAENIRIKADNATQRATILAENAKKLEKTAKLDSRTAQRELLNADVGRHRSVMAELEDRLRRNVFPAKDASLNTRFSDGFEAKFVEAQLSSPKPREGSEPTQIPTQLGEHLFLLGNPNSTDGTSQEFLVSQSQAETVISRRSNQGWEPIFKRPAALGQVRHAALSADGRWLACGLQQDAQLQESNSGSSKLWVIDLQATAPTALPIPQNAEQWSSVGFVEFLPATPASPWTLVAVVEYSTRYETSERLKLHRFQLGNDMRSLDALSEPIALKSSEGNPKFGDNGEDKPIWYMAASSKTTESTDIIVVAEDTRNQLQFQIVRFAESESNGQLKAEGPLVLTGQVRPEQVALASGSNGFSIICGEQRNLYYTNISFGATAANVQTLPIVMDDEVKQISAVANSDQAADFAKFVVADSAGRISTLGLTGGRWQWGRTWRGIGNGSPVVIASATSNTAVRVAAADGQIYDLNLRESGEILQPNLNTLQGESMRVVVRQGVVGGRDGGVAIGTDRGRILLFDQESLQQGLNPEELPAPTAPVASRNGRLDNVGWISEHLILYQKDDSLEVIPSQQKYAEKLIRSADQEYRFSSRQLANQSSAVAMDPTRFIPKLEGASTGEQSVIIVTNHPKPDRLQLWQLSLGEEGPQLLTKKELMIPNAEWRDFAVSPQGKYLVLMQRKVDQPGQGLRNPAQLELGFMRVADLLADQEKTLSTDSYVTWLDENYRRIDDFVGFSTDGQYLALNTVPEPDRYDRRPKTKIQLFDLSNTDPKRIKTSAFTVQQNWSVFDWNQKYGILEESSAFTLGKGRRFFTSVLNNVAVGKASPEVKDLKGEDVIFQEGRRGVQLGMSQIVLSPNGEEITINTSSDSALTLKKRFKKARDMRRFENHLLVLDDDGLQVSAKLLPETLADNKKLTSIEFQTIADSRVECTGLKWEGPWIWASYSNGLAVLYRKNAGESIQEVNRWDDPKSGSFPEFPQFSSDGRWMAYLNSELERLQLFELPNPGERQMAEDGFTVAEEVRGFTWVETSQGSTLLVARFDAANDKIVWQVMDPKSREELAELPEWMANLPKRLPPDVSSETARKARWFVTVAPDSGRFVSLLFWEKNLDSHLGIWATLAPAAAEENSPAVEDRWLGDSPITGVFPEPNSVSFSQIGGPDSPARLATVIKKSGVNEVRYFAIVGAEEAFEDSEEKIRRLRREDFTVLLPRLRGPINAVFSANGFQLIQATQDQVDVYDAHKR